MPGEAYSAGTIFLQVVPVFADVQKKIRRQAQEINDTLGNDMEAAGKKAGERAGTAMGQELEKSVKGSGKKAAEDYSGEFRTELGKALAGMERELKPIKVSVERNELRKEFAEIRGDFKALSEALKLNPNMDAKALYAEMAILDARIKALKAEAKNVEFQTNLGAVERNIDQFLARVRRNFKDIEVPLRVDFKPLERDLGTFETRVKAAAKRAADALGAPISRELKQIQAELRTVQLDIEIGVDMPADQVLAKMAELEARAKQISTESIDIQAKIDAGRVAAELIALRALMGDIDGNTLKVEVDDRGSVARMLGKLAALKAAMTGGLGGEDASNSFRSFSAIILVLLTLIPALIPIIGALGAAILALGPILLSAGAGLGVMAVGFSGIMAAVQAMGQKSKKSAADTAAAAKQIQSALYSVRDAQQAVGDAERNASRSAVDSARAVAQARQSAAEAIRSALEQQKNAQESYANSVKAVQDAEQNLRDAREQAKQDKKSLTNQIADNKLAIRGAVVGAFKATDNLNAVMADGSSTTLDKTEAKLAYDQAQQQLKELRQQQVELQKAQKKTQKEGINGSDAVKSAQDQLTQALQAQQHAQQALGDAARAVDQARVQGAQAVAQAVLQQQRAQEDGQRNIARAQEQLRRAQENYNEALHKANDIGASADQNLRAAMKNLGPAGRKFARFIFGLKQGFYSLRDDIQRAMLPPIQHSIQTIITKYGPKMRAFFTVMAGVGGHLIKRFTKSLDGPEWRGFFKMFNRLGPVMFRLFGKTTIVWMRIFARLMTLAAPAGEAMSKALLGVAKGILKWMNSKRGTKVIQDFLEWARKNGPLVVGFLKDFAKAAIHLGVALAPWGKTVLGVIDGLFKLISKIPTKDLGLLASLIIGLFLAFQVGVGVTSLLLGGMALLASGVGTVVAIVVITIVVLFALYTRFKFVRTIVNLVAKAIGLYVKAVIWVIKHMVKLDLAVLRFIAKTLHMKQIVLWVWDLLKKAAKKVFEAIEWAYHKVVDAAQWVWEKLQPVFAKIGDLLSWLWHKVFRPILGAIGHAFRIAFGIIRGVWNHVLWPVLDLMIHIFTKLWNKVWWPIIKSIGRTFGHMGDIIHQIWKDAIKPVLDAFGKAFNWLWDKVLHPIIKGIGWLWDREMKGLVKIYDRFIKPMVDKFIDLMGGKEGLKSKFEAAVNGIKTIWDGLKKIFAAPIKFVLNTVLNDGLIGGFNKIANFVGSTPIDKIPIPKALAYATGGVLPGYTPGRDPHTFLSPTGGRLDLSGGEAIMRPEFTKAVGPNFVHAMNKLAASGGPKAVKRALGFAKGGIFPGGDPDAKVYINGKPIAAIAAAQIMLAEKIAKRQYFLMQGGFGGDHIAASGTSHNYPGVGDVAAIGGINFGDQAALRKVGFAGWARNIPGAAYVGSGEHVHAASFLSPGTHSSPQLASYLANQNGLDGGPDYGPKPAWLPNLGKLLGGMDLSGLEASTSHHGPGFGLPGWLLKIARNPLGYFTDKVIGPMGDLATKIGKSDFLNEIAGVPVQLVKDVARQAIGLIPGGHQLMGLAGNAISGVETVGDAIGSAVTSGFHALGGLHFAQGGVLPYNGTMKYDAGGYLPPGLTSVVNLTGKPEPVFTHEQMSNLKGGGGGGGSWTYAPTFTKATPDPEELMDELEFTLRKLSRAGGGRYGDARS